jgi:hypothetical protein
MAGLRRERLEQFIAWVAAHIPGDEKGQAQIFLDRLFQAFGQAGCLDVGGTPELRIRKPQEDGGGTAFADYVWKPIVLIEMKKRGEDLARHYRQAFDYWTRLVPGRPRYVVLSNFDEFWVYDFETQMDAPVDKLGLVELPARPGPTRFHRRRDSGHAADRMTAVSKDAKLCIFAVPHRSYVFHDQSVEKRTTKSEYLAALRARGFVPRRPANRRASFRRGDEFAVSEPGTY